MPATVLPPEPAAPEIVHSCPSCSHWLPDGALACPDCKTLTYGQHLNLIASTAQQLEQRQLWAAARDRWRATLAWLPSDAQQALSIEQHIAQLDSRLRAEQDSRSRWTRRLGPFAPVLFFLAKVKSFLFVLLKLKFLLTMFAFFGIYWALYGWQFAAGFTASLLVHELGHYVAVKRRGLTAEMPIFLPGFGAYVRWYGQGVSREDLAAIALAGPVFGLAAAGVCLAIYLATHIPIFYVLTYVGGWINFLNLLPVLGLDGAQATLALSRMQRALIAATCLLLFGLSVSDNNLFGPTTLWIFLIVGLGMLWRTFTADLPETPSTRTFLSFQALVIVLGMLVYKTQFAGMR